MIPKVIHYCWFGGNEKTLLILRCIESWKRYCPDYRIIEWNENNYNINACEYTREAYNAGKWAFVSDYARIEILYLYGGIYLDTDVELHSSLDDLLQYDAWFAQDDIRYVNTGLGFGACQKNDLLRRILLERSTKLFDMTICNKIDTPIIKKYLGLKQSRKSQCIRNIYIIGMNEYSNFGKHWEGNSWKEEADRQFQAKRRTKMWKVKVLLRNPTVINWLERKGETRISKIYIFFVYDLMDNGIIYFIKRKFKRKEDQNV